MVRVDEHWAAVERYLMSHLHPGDTQLDAVVAANAVTRMVSSPVREVVPVSG